MNDRHASGTMTNPAPASQASAAHYASYGGEQGAQYGDFTTYDGYDTGGFPTTAHDATHYGTAHYGSDPLFGGHQTTGHATGAYDTTHWSTGDQQVLNYDQYAAQHHAAAYDTGAYDTTAWSVPQQPTQSDVSGQWDASAWLPPGQQSQPDQTQQWDWNAQSFDTGAYDVTQWNPDGGSAPEQQADPYEQSPHEVEQLSYEEAAFEEDGLEETSATDGESSGTGELPDMTAPFLLEDQEEVTPVPEPRAGSRGSARARRRTPAKRSALLTVAVPSACVMGVAGIAAASVGGLTGDDTDTTASASDAHAVRPSAANNKLDTQLQSLSAGAHDFADRASRTQQRIDLKAQRVADQKKAAAEAALKERMRPKFLLPVTQKGLSAYFGQAGVNWMSVHTGIDFPVSYGTTVMAATDGTVQTKWNDAYGNMLILTAKDGTETWYCHLSHYRVPAGTAVKAGDPIAYSGNSGNSTGPHLHFEVHPGGGAAVDPLPWLRSHGLNPE